MIIQSRDFFHLPQSKKEELACPPGPNPQRGWTGPGSGEYVAKTRKENYEGLDVNKLIDARVSISLYVNISLDFNFSFY